MSRKYRSGVLQRDAAHCYARAKPELQDAALDLKSASSFTVIR
jgi:hypothetical protein